MTGKFSVTFSFKLINLPFSSVIFDQKKSTCNCSQLRLPALTMRLCNMNLSQKDVMTIFLPLQVDHFYFNQKIVLYFLLNLYLCVMLSYYSLTLCVSTVLYYRNALFLILKTISILRVEEFKIMKASIIFVRGIIIR